MYTIRDATEAFFALDRVPPEKGAALDKTLRNLSQRVYMPPVGRSGRADTYSLETICALRLLHKASLFGLDRWQLEKLAQYLHVADSMAGDQTEKFSGGFRHLPPIEEAVQRVRVGEVFNIGIAMLSDGTIKPFVDWRPLGETEEIAEKGVALLAGAGLQRLPQDAAFILPASRLIGELIEVLDVAD
ncbi:hypothetical protein ROG8370_03196 [Roseovarius gaetbuli]|uniref:HTH merR-type domain-containing protein n=1 Tax=Roseovarius gaetbuli TaxID=1356575 RepID=A0A1X7A2E8_9RHOB|nr:hypothetical protein [Roseovarius gaetbuli]SLN68172.1 hypothetical protein ROG8370_03196 [Roseovarius gaetbuli]